MMERRVRGNSHARCEAGEKVESGANAPLRPYLSLFIFVRKAECVDSFTLNEMIEEVNRTQVDREEWLSDHTYLYQRKNQKLISITNH